MNYHKKSIKQLTSKMDKDQLDAFNMGVNKAFSMYFDTLNAIGNKVFILPMDAKELDMHVMEILINQNIHNPHPLFPSKYSYCPINDRIKKCKK